MNRRQVFKAAIAAAILAMLPKEPRKESEGVFLHVDPGYDNSPVVKTRATLPSPMYSLVPGTALVSTIMSEELLKDCLDRDNMMKRAWAIVARDAADRMDREIMLSWASDIENA